MYFTVRKLDLIKLLFFFFFFFDDPKTFSQTSQSWSVMSYHLPAVRPETTLPAEGTVFMSASGTENKGPAVRFCWDSSPSPPRRWECHGSGMAEPSWNPASCLHQPRCPTWGKGVVSLLQVSVSRIVLWFKVSETPGSGLNTRHALGRHQMRTSPGSHRLAAQGQEGSSSWRVMTL